MTRPDGLSGFYVLRNNGPQYRRLPGPERVVNLGDLMIGYMVSVTRIRHLVLGWWPISPGGHRSIVLNRGDNVYGYAWSSGVRPAADCQAGVRGPGFHGVRFRTA